MRVRNTVAAGCGLAALAGCSPGTPSPPRTTAAAVVRVIDGDTLVLRRSGRAERARLIGVDAPEVWSRRDCFGDAAARALRRLAPPGASVRVAGDREKYDRYGRRLVYLWAARFVNADLIRAGFARAMVVRPNDRFLPLLRSAEATARRRHRGLWRACRWPNAVGLLFRAAASSAAVTPRAADKPGTPAGGTLPSYAVTHPSGCSI